MGINWIIIKQKMNIKKNLISLTLKLLKLFRLADKVEKNPDKTSTV